MNDTRADLSELQRQSLQSSFLDLERRLTDIEAAMFAVEHRSPLSKYVLDLTPVEMGVVRDYCQRIRTAMLDLLAEQEIEVRIRRVGLRWSLLTHAAYLHVAVSDISADRLRGYGPVSAVDRLSQRLDVLVDQLDSFLRERPDDLKRRVAHSSAPAELSRIVAATAEIVTRQALVEYRPKLNAILDRLERADLEIALFGRVSSGKSSLLNHIAGTDVLPVGVTPITAVPTRLTWGESPLGRITFAESLPRQIDVSKVADFASEENNPGNIKRVTRIEAQIPSERLHKGVVFVDTPGVGSLARQGSSETFEYLPRCDLGVVLIDASSTLNEDDISLIRLLRDTGATVQVLLSKVDLLSPADRKRMVDYLVQRLAERFGDAVPVFAVSVMQGYEGLWQQWFEQQVMPQQREHQKLASESLFRKTLRLVEAVRATLDSRLNKPASVGAKANEHVEQVRQLLSRGDDVIRDLTFQTVRWRDKLRPAEEEVVEQAAGKLVGGMSSQESMQEIVSSTLRQLLQRRSEMVRKIAVDAKARLSETIREIQTASDAPEIDPDAIDDLSLHNLPAPEELPWDSTILPGVPWWSSFAPPMARTVLIRSLHERLGSLLSSASANHHRALELWLKTVSTRLQQTYEAQVAALRTRIQHDTGENSNSSENRDAIQRDLKILDEITASSTVG